MIRPTLSRNQTDWETTRHLQHEAGARASQKDKQRRPGPVVLPNIGGSSTSGGSTSSGSSSGASSTSTLVTPPPTSSSGNRTGGPQTPWGVSSMFALLNLQRLDEHDEFDEEPPIGHILLPGEPIVSGRHRALERFQEWEKANRQVLRKMDVQARWELYISDPELQRLGKPSTTPRSPTVVAAPATAQTPITSASVRSEGREVANPCCQYCKYCKHNADSSARPRRNSMS